MSEEACQRCGEPGEDRRTLWMACFYAMSELGLPFSRNREGERDFYTLRVCKDCRADWMTAIKGWFENVQARKPVGSGIFVRENGATVEITEEEWNRRNPGRESIRMHPARAALETK